MCETGGAEHTARRGGLGGGWGVKGVGTCGGEGESACVWGGGGKQVQGGDEVCRVKLDPSRSHILILLVRLSQRAEVYS